MTDIILKEAPNKKKIKLSEKQADIATLRHYNKD